MALLSHSLPHSFIRHVPRRLDFLCDRSFLGIRVYSISRIKVFSGVGFVDQKITAFRLLYCNRKGGAYFSGYDTQVWCGVFVVGDHA